MSDPKEIDNKLDIADSLADFGAGGSANDYLDEVEQTLEEMME